MKRILSCFAMSMVAALLLAPAGASADGVNLGSVACSGVLDVETFGSVGLRCEGNLSLTDSVISDPIQILIEASGRLTITRSQIHAPVVRLEAEQIALENSMVSGHELFLVGRSSVFEGEPLPPREPHLEEQVLPPGASGSITIHGGQITLTSHPSTLTQSGRDGRTPPVILNPPVRGDLILVSTPVPPVGGDLTLVSGPILIPIASTLFEANSGVPPVSSVPEPSAALFLLSGLGVISLRRRMKLVL
ncbi:MAG: hypothetical protein B7Z51_05790 [Methyloversatilis sp. 12-65-5]|nr:MAG: hypothetical protein B7Z51_05790 [Methyloversatilis sp. 12-65-5]